jgi:tetratricopeptide (TPR) repeat protein
MKESLQALLQLDIERSDSLIKNISNTYEKAYIKHYQLFIDKMVLGNSITDFQKQSEDIIERFINKDDISAKNTSYLAEIYIQKGIIDYSNKKNYQAAKSFYKAYSYWQESSKDQENLKLTGIFQLLLAKIPEPYAKPAGWFGFKGDALAGLKALKNHCNTSFSIKGFHEEAILYLGFAYLKFGKDKNEIKKFILQHVNNPVESPLCQAIIIRCAFRINEPDLCNNWLQSDKACKHPPLHYLKGKYAALCQDSATAKYMNVFFTLTKNNHFIADAHKYLSWYYFIKDDTLSYLKHQSLIRKIKYYPTWADQKAYQESTSCQIPNKFLLMSRMLFDVGNINQALLLLHKKKNDILKNKQFKSEYYYRLARCYHHLNNVELAINYYTISLNSTPTSSDTLIQIKQQAYFFLQELDTQQN